MVLTFAVPACGGDSSSETSSGSAPPPGFSPPELARWEAQMKTYGQQHCQELRDSRLSADERLTATYYDGEWVYYQISQYTGDKSWLSCAQLAETIYRDGYVVANKGAVPGYWNFSHGLTLDFLQSGDRASREAAISLSKNAAFARDDTPAEWTVSADLSREVAYAMMSYLNAERLGQPRRSRLNLLVDQALGHMNQWFVQKSAPYVRPFMVALTSQALISWYEVSNDERVVPAIMRAANGLWNDCWLPASEAFMYTDRQTASGGQEPAPDLNLLIAPVYGWLYQQTRQEKYRERGDQIFAGGVRQAGLGGAKQFNQNYRWSFSYVRWRSSTSKLPPS